MAVDKLGNSLRLTGARTFLLRVIIAPVLETIYFFRTLISMDDIRKAWDPLVMVDPLCRYDGKMFTAQLFPP